ncbi:MAG: bifunctional phosphoribosyl-AMP cyclohydrolase/phosphoribosyl-ATP diphosphatase HisIE [Bacteroidota bacterium]|jgi:phosphoribosyl-ATP pyrophosphohydrolase/phosphoribosyl-AMP cyclohydrolase|nr:bifunctional phosphoribosyl-AMP cyclohydrolase/phosphoribosyl-ATP diphosphatase HisIE [Bacteroidota bacterium]MCA6443335.1 bifunctional phosphoribosyl-AMP cyclohydrolase/phosphoribosyl-ATP diphosphatase HisIE [Bacteroidota bacterium]
MSEFNTKRPEFEKYVDGLMPAIIQDANTKVVLMLGFMNEESFQKTLQTKLITFFSRSKNRLWTKGEGSKNYMHLVSHVIDCDNDTLLFQVNPAGPVCHTGTDTCFGNCEDSHGFIYKLEGVIDSRIAFPTEQSYVNKLLSKGINKVAQKVGEEAVELVIEAKDTNRDLFLGEAADLMFHFILLIKAKGYSLKDVETVLKERHK